MTSRSESFECQGAWELVAQGRYEEAFAECRDLAHAGSSIAQVFLGWMYQTGKGVQKDLHEAEAWYRKAVAVEARAAAFYLATVYREQRDSARALEWFLESASNKYPPGIYHLGRMYRYGIEGVEKDQEKAWAYLEEAARKGHLFARRDIAHEQLTGHRGLVQIPLGALSMLSVLWKAYRAALKHHPHSEFMLLTSEFTLKL